jgi:hypothetical protein
MGNGGYTGGHTRILVGEHTFWPDEWTGYASTYKRWGPDGFVPATQQERRASPGAILKIYEMKLLAGLARCFRGEISLKQLPLIPQPLADQIIKAGGLGCWVDADPRRRAKFDSMVERQQAIAAAPVVVSGKNRKPKR